jgi:hypothetical protein
MKPATEIEDESGLLFNKHFGFVRKVSSTLGFIIPSSSSKSLPVDKSFYSKNASMYNANGIEKSGFL